MLNLPSQSWADIQVQGYLNNAALENVAADPSCAPAVTCPEGRMIWDSVLNKFRIWDGSVWSDVVFGTATVPDPLLLGDGTVTDPTYSFASDPNTGVFSAGVDDLGFSAGGEARLNLSDNSAFGATFADPNGNMRLLIDAGSGTSYLRLLASDGVASSDSSIEFGDLADGDSGRLQYDHSTDNFNFYAATELIFALSDGNTNFNNTNGANTLVVNGNEGGATLRLDANHTTPGGADSIIEFGDTGDSDRGRIIYDHSTDDMSSLTSAATRFTIGPTIRPSVVTRNIDGAQGTPSYSFANSTTMGMYRRDGGSIGFSTGGTEKFFVGTTTNRSILPIQAPDGDATLPGFNFFGDTNTGMYRSAGGSLVLAVNGTTVFSSGGSNVQIRIPTTSTTFGICALTDGGGLETIVDCSTSSSREVKRDIEDLGPDFGIDGLRPRKYFYDTERWPTQGYDENLQVGLIAEEVAETHPEFVTYTSHKDENGNPMPDVKYGNIVSLLIKEIQDLKKRVHELEAEK